jgi:YggT family protein
MDRSYLANPAIFLIQTLFGLYTLAVVLRFLLQWARADFYNPISQLIVRVTAPLLNPLRRVIPGWARLDFAALTLAWLLKTLELWLVVLLLGLGSHLFNALLWAIPALVDLLLNILLFTILVQVVLSWIGRPGDYYFISTLIHSLTLPFLRPVLNWMPPMPGLDLSPMIVTVGLILLKMLLLPPLKYFTGSPF